MTKIDLTTAASTDISKIAFTKEQLLDLALAQMKCREAVYESRIKQLQENNEKLKLTVKSLKAELVLIQTGRKRRRELQWKR